MNKRALIVGIDHYVRKQLRGCVNDAKKITKLLAEHEDNRDNFDCRLVVSKSSNNLEITRFSIISRLKKLFKMKVDTALFYFSGHGVYDEEGLQLVMQDGRDNLSLASIATLIKESTILKVVIILDCCYSGGAGNFPFLNDDKTFLQDGVSILAASGRDEYSMEINDAGLFTSIIASALEGEAADLFGNVNVANVYNHADQLLSHWEHRPVFKGYLSSMTVLRECIPRVTRKELNFITSIFKDKEDKYLLDKSYEHTEEPRNSKNESLFALLQKFVANALVEPVGARSMYDAAMDNKSCQLTKQGRFYWSIINKRNNRYGR